TYVGWLYAAVGAGSVLGSLAFLRPNPRHIRRRDIVVFSVIELVLAGAFVLENYFLLACLFLLVSSLSAVAWQILGAIAMQQRLPVGLLGRANGAYRFAMYSGMFVGALAALLLVNSLGWERMVLVVCGGALIVLAAFTITGPRDRVRQTPLSDLPD
ncbi:MAG: hypothetical protein ABR498_00230, partial [Candidatus Dormibacteria bacterium]